MTKEVNVKGILGAKKGHVQSGAYVEVQFKLGPLG